MVMDAEGSQAGADLLDANMVYWSTASIDGDGLKLKEQNWEQTFPSQHLCAIKELLPACDCLFILKSSGDVAPTSEVRSALHLTGASSVVLPALQAPPLSTDGKEACLLRALVMLAFLKYLRKHEKTNRCTAHALRDAQRWLRDATLQDARKLLQKAPLDPTEKKEFATSMLDAFSDLTHETSPGPMRLGRVLAIWKSGSGLQGAGWTEKDNNYVLGNDDSSEDSEDEDADAGDKYFAAQFDEFCNTRDGRRLVREARPEKALKQWKQKSRATSASPRRLEHWRGAVWNEPARRRRAPPRGAPRPRPLSRAGPCEACCGEAEKQRVGGVCSVLASRAVGHCAALERPRPRPRPARRRSRGPRARRSGRRARARRRALGAGDGHARVAQSPDAGGVVGRRRGDGVLDDDDAKPAALRPRADCATQTSVSRPTNIHVSTPRASATASTAARMSGCP